MDSSYPRLVGDVGGTNARFAWLEAPGAPLRDIETLPTDACPSLLDAVRAYLARGGRPAPRWAAIGIANPVVGDHVQMTNHHWSFSIAALRRDLGLDRLLVLNDFTALALALPALEPADVRPVGGGRAIAGAPVALLGAGTGLGASGLLPAGRGRRAIPLGGEGGHATLAATNAREADVIDALRRRFGHVSAERAVSGQGIENLHRALCELAGEPPPGWDAPEISRRGLDGTDARSVDAMDLFFGFLGTVAGNLALTLGARGGVYLGGGILPRLGDAIDRSRFRQAFEAKGRMSDYVAAIPTWVLQARESPALTGAARALDDLDALAD
jgi:glucokinase